MTYCCCQPAQPDARRINSWSLPYSCRFLFAVSVYFGNIAAFVLFLRPLLAEPLKSHLSAGFAGLSFLVFSMGFLTTWIDPVDALVTAGKREEEAAPAPGADLKRVKYCRYCEVDVQVHSKHCWECNKCVDDFDHHCPWLNTCIGARNYPPFFVCVLSFLGFVGLSAAVALLLFISIAVPGLGDSLVARSDLLAPEHVDQLSHHVSPAFGTLLGLVLLTLFDLLLWTLVLALAGFHTYLCVMRMTTYEYLTGKGPKHLNQPHISSSRSAPSVDKRTITASFAEVTPAAMKEDHDDLEAPPLDLLPSPASAQTSRPPSFETIEHVELARQNSGLSAFWSHLSEEVHGFGVRREVSFFLFGTDSVMNEDFAYDDTASCARSSVRSACSESEPRRLPPTAAAPAVEAALQSPPPTLLLGGAAARREASYAGNQRGDEKPGGQKGDEKPGAQKADEKALPGAQRGDEKALPCAQRGDENSLPCAQKEDEKTSPPKIDVQVTPFAPSRSSLCGVPSGFLRGCEDAQVTREDAENEPGSCTCSL